jgi:hypothetical protein
MTGSNPGSPWVQKGKLAFTLSISVRWFKSIGTQSSILNSVGFVEVTGTGETVGFQINNRDLSINDVNSVF